MNDSSEKNMKAIIAKNVDEVNYIINKVMIGFLFVPIIFIMLSKWGIFSVSTDYCWIWFMALLIFDVAVTFLNELKIPSEAAKYIEIISLEAVIMIGALQINVGLYSVYILPAIVSCAYLDKKFSSITSFICYICMIISLYVRSFYGADAEINPYGICRWFIVCAGGYTLEYIILSLGIRLVTDRTMEFYMDLYTQHEKIIKMQKHTINSFADLVESRDTSTGQHIKRTSSYVNIIINAMKRQGIYSDVLTDDYCNILKDAAPLHDIGKIAVPDYVLCKKGKLTPEEYDIIKNHTKHGARIIERTMTNLEDSDFVETAVNISLYHHEKWDGSGYPDGKKGEDIPLCARIMSVADVFDALISKRCYKAPMSYEEAFKIIEKSKGTHFDPKVVDAFLSSKEEVYKLKDRGVC